MVGLYGWPHMTDLILIDNDAMWETVLYDSIGKQNSWL